MDVANDARAITPQDDGEGRTTDVIIIGGGAAGLSAALMLGRAGRSTIVVDAGQPRNRFAEHMHGFLSRDGMAPAEFLALGRAEVESYGGVIRGGTVVVATANEQGTRVEVVLDDGTRLVGRRLLLATGLRDELPPIEGIAERWGKDVLHCPYCHGHEVRNQPLGVIAVGDVSLHQIQLIRQWTSDLVYFLNGQPAPDAPVLERLQARGIRVVEGVVQRLIIDEATDRLTGVALEDGSIIARTALFTASKLVAEDPLLRDLGVEIERNEVFSKVVTDKLGQTSVPGVFAAGNVSDPMSQVIHAAGAGALAGGGINWSLVEEDFVMAVEAEATSAA